MILNPAYDQSCRTNKIKIKINAENRREEKAAANRIFRRKLKNIIHCLFIGNYDWDGLDFGNLPRYTNWEIY